jgi:putative nucleotidyltransferase with HDIG domain
MRRFETRYALWQQGARLSVINLAVLGVLHLLDPSPVGWPTLYEAGAAVLNGWGVAFLAATLLPLLERAFDITTNLRLLELSNMNQPALKELAVRAPGTYHHSIVVGNLSESAADGIGVNPLLVRVASYYHDLGKMLCPLYFVENQGQRNFHDDLPAKTSARIIVNHVRDGLEIARRYKLGSAITDIVAQHHGDSLVRYFFHKAQEELDGGAQGLDEAEFRYPGPRPQADGAEAGDAHLHGRRVGRVGLDLQRPQLHRKDVHAHAAEHPPPPHHIPGIPGAPWLHRGSGAPGRPGPFASRRAGT